MQCACGLPLRALPRCHISTHYSYTYIHTYIHIHTVTYMYHASYAHQKLKTEALNPQLLFCIPEPARHLCDTVMRLCNADVDEAERNYQEADDGRQKL